MRVGVSFIAAFVFAFLVRRAVKWALIIGGVLTAAAYFLNKLGLGISHDQLVELQNHVQSGADAVQHSADSLWESTIKPQLPNTSAAGVGLWRGLRHQQPKA